MPHEIPTTPVAEQAKQARLARHHLARTTGEQRAALLEDLAARLTRESEQILAANAQDMQAARDAAMSGAMQDRLLLTTQRIAAQADDLRRIARLPDPLAERYDQRLLDSGLQLARQRVPLGVLGVIYESRPNVTVDVAALGLKSGNALVLRGGREARQSNRALAGLIHQTLNDQSLPEALLQFVDRPERDSVLEMLACVGSIDLLIPRGGAALQQLCLERSRIPVVTGGIGICHIYVDASADIARSIPLIENAKVQRPTVCNALDTVLLHRDVAATLLPALHARLQPQGVSFHVDASAAELLSGKAGVHAAQEGDFDREWLSLVLSVAVVDDLDQAIAHIQAHSSGHSEAILSETPEHVRRFVAEVDSAAVYVNASTRFTDGGQFGLGAEVAVSTQRLHARGPMGLRELTTYKWVGQGDYLQRR